ncbi:MAG TPA: PfkB family carbohydrate kinase [Nakamurella sp.]
MSRADPAGPRHVTVVGDLGVDIRVGMTGAIVPGQDIRARISSGPGGAGANTSAWLSRLGVPVSLIARIGADPAGAAAAAELAAAGVDCRLAIDPELPTCCVIVVIHPDGERTMLSDRGANARLSPGDLDLPDRPGRGHLHLSGYPLFDTDSRAAALAAIRAAGARGWTVSVDPQSSTHLRDVGPAVFLEWIRGADLLLPNADELEALGGPTAVLEVVPAIAVTEGVRGARWYGSGGSASVEPPEVHRTDSTGAGDAFNAGVLAAWLSGADPRAALVAGVAMGTAAAGAPGGRPDRPGTVGT